MEYPNADDFRSLAATVTNKAIVEELVATMQKACSLFFKNAYDNIKKSSKVRSYKTHTHLDLNISHFPMSEDSQHTIRNGLANFIAEFFRDRGFDVVVNDSSLPWVRLDFEWYPTTILDKDSVDCADLVKRITYIKN